MRRTTGSLLAAACAALIWIGGRVLPAPATAPGPRASLPEACRAVGLPYPPPQPGVVIYKRKRLLHLLSGTKLVKEYPVVLGTSPEGDKEREGDRRTPEGSFYVCTRVDRSQFVRFLGISYPAPDDARRALRARRITRGQYTAILRAHAARLQPPWNTPLGGAVGIHGGGTASDWTWGCIALENPDIEELYTALTIGTRVRIEP